LDFCSGISTEWLFIHWFQIEFGNVGFCGGRKTGEPREKPSGQGREPTTNSAHVWHRDWESNPATLVRGECSNHCVIPAPALLGHLIAISVNNMTLIYCYIVFWGRSSNCYIIKHIKRFFWLSNLQSNTKVMVSHTYSVEHHTVATCYKCFISLILPLPQPNWNARTVGGGTVKFHIAPPSGAKLFHISKINPSSLNSDQHQISPYNIPTSLNTQVMRIKEMITKHEMSWCLCKFSQLVS